MKYDFSEISEIIKVIDSFTVKNKDKKEMLKICILVKLDVVSALNKYIEDSSNRMDAYELVDEAIKVIKGPAFTLTPHGIKRTIDGRYNVERKIEIINAIHDFSKYLYSTLEIESFITSGTLLGLVREGAFLGHDDDFDVAYISNNHAREEIIKERVTLYDTINLSDRFEASERTGGRLAVTARCKGFEFNFDLFTSWGDKDGFFNEFPLKPKTIKVDQISPVKTVKFYGVDINVPLVPEALLELNYGVGWKVPDPTFRFRYGEHQPYYRFLMNNKIKA
jgi:hypothetical protein